jgi:hypothetical protein
MSYDTEVGARTEKFDETNPAREIEISHASRVEKSTLTALGDLVPFWPCRASDAKNMGIRGNKGGAIPPAPTFQSLPFAEFRKTSVICEKCLGRRTRWLFSRNRFLKWRRCFACMNDLERCAVALTLELTVKRGR